MTKARTFQQASLFVTVATGASLLAGAAMAQMYEKPYGFAARDRAGLAVYMKNLDESRSNSGTVSSGAGDATYLVCGGGGGGGSASSTANSSCIIVNNSDARLTLSWIKCAIGVHPMADSNARKKLRRDIPEILTKSSNWTGSAK